MMSQKNDRYLGTKVVMGITFIIGISVFLFSKKLVNNVATISSIKKLEECEEGQLAARIDYRNGELNYYVFGIAIPSQTLINKLDTCCDVTIVSMSCVPELKLSCYNEVADSIILSKSGLHFYEL